MERVHVESETLATVGYRENVLEIEFTSGRVYQYFDVPASIHQELMQAGSKGGYFNKHIRGHYRYARL
jgi:hypothetical protein